MTSKAELAERDRQEWLRMQGAGQVTYNNVTLEMRAEDRAKGFIAGYDAYEAANELIADLRAKVGLKVDEKRLSTLTKSAECGFVVAPPEMLEILSLARLGLWAEKHGIPAISQVKTANQTEMFGGMNLSNQIEVIVNDALAALPKGQD